MMKFHLVFIFDWVVAGKTIEDTIATLLSENLLLLGVRYLSFDSNQHFSP